MQLRLLGAGDLEVARIAEPGMELVGDADGRGLSPVQMLAASLALCTGAVMQAYAAGVAKVGIAELTIRVRWSIAEGRIDRMETLVRWPELPEERLAPAQRAAKRCTVHRTLERPPEMTTQVVR